MRLAQYIAQLEQVASGNYLEPLSEKIGVDVRELTQAGFDGEQDPYGIPWAQRKKEYAHPILNRSGVMKSTIVVSSTPTGVRATALAPYAGFHQYGTRYMVARRIFPKAERGLGTWRERIEATCQTVLQRFLKAAA